MEYLLSIVLQTVILKTFDNEKKKDLWLRSSVKDKVGVLIIFPSH